ncbi:MAG: SpoIIE family protein phosphatase [Symbiobacteriia bacterium]
MTQPSIGQGPLPWRSPATLRAFRLYLTVAVAAVLLGRATVYGILFPFLPALVAALATTAPVAAAVAAVVGLVSLYGAWGAPAALLAGGGLGLWAVAVVLLRGRPLQGPASPLLLGLAGLLVGAVGARLQAAAPEPYWLAVMQGVFAAALAATYTPALHSLAAARDPHAARPPAARLAAVALAGSMVAGLDGLVVAGLSPAITLGSFLLALVTLAAGGGQAAAAGALFAATASLARGIAVADMGTYAFAAALAGVLAGLGSAGVVFGILLGFLGASYSSATAAALTTTLLSALVGSLTAAVLPRRWWRGLAEGLGLGPAAADESTAGTGAAAARALAAQASLRLKAVAGLFEELARAFQEPAPAAAEREGTAVAALGGAAADMAGTPPGGGELADLLQAVAAKACQHCELQHTCWQPEFYRTYRNLSDAWAVAESGGGITPGRMPEDFRRQCIHVPDMAAAVNQVQDLARLSRFWERRTAEGRTLVAAQLSGVAQIMDELAAGVLHEAEAGPAGGGDSNHRSHRPAAGATLGYQVGVSRASKGGAPVSGDALLHRQLDGNRLLLALSDGMGAGPLAARESRVTIDLIERLLAAGFAPDVAIRTINSILLLRSPEETFATLDLLLLRLESGRADFLKTGAAPSFVRRGSRVSVIKSASLPAGILTQIEVPLTQHQLRAGDLVVMVTDGLLTDLSEGEVADFLQRFPRQEPQLVAEALLSRALGGPASRPLDDITVCVVLLTAAEETTGHTGAGWVPVRWRPIAPPRKSGRL